jgi:hypothetical protein
VAPAVRAIRRTARFLPLALAAALAPASAEPVSVNSPEGQGFTVAHRNNCYVLLPQHVHGGRQSLSLASGAPPVVGEGRVFQTFAPGMDLSVAFVTGGLEGRCMQRFVDLPRNVDPLIAAGGEVSFVTVWKGGRVQRVRGRVATIAYEEMTIDVEDDAPDTAMFPGRSGGVVLAGDTPVGMIVEAVGTRQAVALRMDAIVLRIERLLAGGIGSDPATEPATAPAAAPDAGIAGLADAISRCSAEPLTPEASCWALAAGSGPLLVPAGTLPFSLDLRLNGGAAVPVGRVRMRTDPDEGTWTAPKSVIVERNAGTPERPFWISYGRADMSPFGELELAHGAAPRTAALRITVLDVWDPSLPLRLDRIEVR